MHFQGGSLPWLDVSGEGLSSSPSGLLTYSHRMVAGSPQRKLSVGQDRSYSVFADLVWELGYGQFCHNLLVT